DEQAVFVFAGEDADEGKARQTASALGLATRVRFLGRQSIADFGDLAAAVDIGVNLRRAPTNGGTSGALLFLSFAGTPTIVTDVGTFSDYPETVVRKVKWDSRGEEELTRVLVDLAGDPALRMRLSRSAWEYVDQNHEWSRIAEQYAAVIERFHAERAAT